VCSTRTSGPCRTTRSTRSIASRSSEYGRGKGGKGELLGGPAEDDDD
jgi:hypothetical protein